MKLSPQLQHLTLAAVTVLALGATVALQVAHVPVPPLLDLIDSSAAGALFGVTMPGGGGNGGAQ